MNSNTALKYLLTYFSFITKAFGLTSVQLLYLAVF
jgi:hypothetical protein